MESCTGIDAYQNQKLLIDSDMVTNANVGKQVVKNLGAWVAIQSVVNGVKVIIVVAYWAG